MSKGKNYVDSSKIIDKSKLYDSAEAMKLVVETAKAKLTKQSNSTLSSALILVTQINKSEAL